MANGDISQVSDQYLQQFDRSVGVSGMQKLQEFPSLQVLGYNGQLGSMKNDFHGLSDFKSQMDKYSSVSHTLKIAWQLIKFIVPNNASIQGKLFTTPGLGTVGNAFKSIHNFGQVFALNPGDLQSPTTVSSKASVYKSQSSQASVINSFASSADIGGGAGVTPSSNANTINGILVLGSPTVSNNTLKFDGTNLIWAPVTGGGGGSASTFLFTQSVASSTWVIPHNLGKFPSVTIFDSTGREVKGQIHYDTTNQVTLTFSAPFSGEASLI